MGKEETGLPWRCPKGRCGLMGLSYKSHLQYVEVLAPIPSHIWKKWYEKLLIQIENICLSYWMFVITVDNHSGVHDEKVKEKKQGESFKPTAHLETVSFHRVLLFYQHPWWQKPPQPTSIRKSCLDAHYVSVAQSLPTENLYKAPNLLPGYAMPLKGKKKKKCIIGISVPETHQEMITQRKSCLPSVRPAKS